MTDTLMARCKEFNQRLGRNAMLRQGDPVQDIHDFVLSEVGRSADVSLEPAKALVLYFGSDEDRREMVAAIKEAKPGMLVRHFP